MDKGMKSLKPIPESKSLEDIEVSSPYMSRCPSIYVDSKQMPEIDEWEVGKEYLLTVRVCMKSYSIREESDRSNAEIEIESYARKTEKSLD